MNTSRAWMRVVLPHSRAGSSQGDLDGKDGSGGTVLRGQ